MFTTLLDDAKSVAAGAGNAIDKAVTAHSYYADQSITQFAKITQVEPITVVSADLLTNDNTPVIMQTMLSIFTAYYLQAANIIAAVDSARIIKTLDRLNPDRDASGYLMNLSSEEATYRLGLESNYKYKLPSIFKPSTEDDSDEKKNESALGFRNTPTTGTSLTEAANLAIGRLIEVKFEGKSGKDNKSVVVNVRVRLAPVILANVVVEKILALKTDSTSLVERYHAWRSGRIKFIRDLIFCVDLIDEQKKAMMYDENGVYSETMRRRNNAKKYGLLTSNPSLASASSIYVISEEVASKIEQKFSGKFSEKRVIDKVFENTAAMLIAVYDREWDRVTFYTRGIHQSSDYSIKELKSVNKSDNGIDLKDLMKTFTMGQSPSF